CQLDEQWFNLHKDILKDALDITLTNVNNPFMAPPSSKTARFDRSRHPVLQILWGIIHSSNTDYAKRIWEEFVQSLQTFLTDRKNLATTSRGKKTTHLLILSIRYVGKDGREIFGIPIHDALITDEIKGAPNYGAKESSKAIKVTKSKAAKATKPASDPKPKPVPTQPPKVVPEKKRKLVQETLEEPSTAKKIKGWMNVPVEEPAYNKEEANLQRALELSLEEQAKRTQGPARPVAIREPDSGRIQPLPKRRTTMPAEASGPAESPSLDAKLALADSKTESDDEAGPNPDLQDEGQAESNLGDAARSQPQPSHMVYAGPNLELMDLEATDALPLQKPEQLDEEFTITAYPSVQENLKLPSKDPKILQQRMFKSKYYEAHEDHKKLYDALEKSLECDYSDQLLSDLEEALQKKRKRRASGSSQLPPPPPPLFIGTSGSTQQQGSRAPSSLQECSPTKSLFDKRLVETTTLRGNTNDSEPTWTIPSSNVSDVKNNWATALASTYVTYAETHCLQRLKFQMEECHKLLTNQVDWTNPEGDQVRVNVNRPLPLDSPSGHVTIQSQFLFNKDLEYLRHGSKGSSPALSISKMKAASYPDFGLKLLVPKQMWIEDVCTYDISAKVDLQEHTIAERDFKKLHPSDFEDLNLLLLQGHLDHLPGSDRRMLYTAVKLWTRNLVIRHRVEDFQLDFGNTGLQSQGIQDQAAQSRYEYMFLDSKGCDKEQRVHRGY
nr:hypothetical protein [Tanacetum cinerariifolium]